VWLWCLGLRGLVHVEHALDAQEGDGEVSFLEARGRALVVVHGDGIADGLRGDRANGLTVVAAVTVRPTALVGLELFDGHVDGVTADIDTEGLGLRSAFGLVGVRHWSLLGRTRSNSP